MTLCRIGAAFGGLNCSLTDDGGRMRYFAVTTMLILAGLTGGAAAHHGWGSYDASRTLTIESPVQHLQWQNPHVHIRLMHQNEAWTIVLAPVSRMQLRGLSAELIKEGTQVSAEGYSSRRVENEMRAERIRVAGKIYELR
jgi:hypothetical protein